MLTLAEQTEFSSQDLTVAFKEPIPIKYRMDEYVCMYVAIAILFDKILKAKVNLLCSSAKLLSSKIFFFGLAVSHTPICNHIQILHTHSTQYIY